MDALVVYGALLKKFNPDTGLYKESDSCNGSFNHDWFRTIANVTIRKNGIRLVSIH